MAAEFDDWVDRPHFDRLVTALDDAGTNYNAEWIDGVHHDLLSTRKMTTKRRQSDTGSCCTLFDRNLKSAS